MGVITAKGQLRRGACLTESDRCDRREPECSWPAQSWEFRATTFLI